MLIIFAVITFGLLGIEKLLDHSLSRTSRAKRRRAPLALTRAQSIPAGNICCRHYRYHRKKAA